MCISTQNQLLEGYFAIISIKRTLNKRDISWLLILANSIKREVVIYYVKKEIPMIILRLFPNNHEMDADRTWNSPLCILTFNLKPFLEELSMGSCTIDRFPIPYLPMFCFLSLLVKTM